MTVNISKDLPAKYSGQHYLSYENPKAILYTKLNQAFFPTTAKNMTKVNVLFIQTSGLGLLNETCSVDIIVWVFPAWVPQHIKVEMKR